MMRVAISDRLAVIYECIGETSITCVSKENEGKMHAAYCLIDVRTQKNPSSAAIVAIAQRLSNQIESFAKVDANRQSKRYGYVRIRRYLFSWHESEQRRPSQTKSSSDKVIFRRNRKRFGFGFGFNSPAIILLKRQRSTGLGRAGAMDCLRRCIVISGRRPGGAMVGCVLDDVLFCNCVLLLDG